MHLDDSAPSQQSGENVTKEKEEPCGSNPVAGMFPACFEKDKDSDTVSTLGSNCAESSSQGARPDSFALVDPADGFPSPLP